MGTIDRCLGLQECEVSLESQSRAKNQWHGGFGGGWKPQLPAAAQATDSILCALRAGHVVVGMSPKLTGRQRHGGCIRVSRLTHQASRSSHSMGHNRSLFCLCCQSLCTPGTPGRWSPWPAVCTCFIHRPHKDLGGQHLLTSFVRH